MTRPATNSRREFSRATRRDALRRSGMLCEAVGPRYGFAKGHRCNASLGKGVEFHHELEAEFGGDNSLENCLAICISCHRFVSKIGIRAIRKSDRVRDKASGAFKPSSRGFRKPPPGYVYDWGRRRGYAKP